MFDIDLGGARGGGVHGGVGVAEWMAWFLSNGPDHLFHPGAPFFCLMTDGGKRRR